MFVQNKSDCPTFSFVDAIWLQGTVDLAFDPRNGRKDWGCDCVFFFNYGRIKCRDQQPSCCEAHGRCYLDKSVQRTTARLCADPQDQDSARFTCWRNIGLCAKSSRSKVRSAIPVQTGRPAISAPLTLLVIICRRKIFVGTPIMGERHHRLERAQQKTKACHPLLIHLRRPTHRFFSPCLDLLSALKDDLVKVYAGRSRTMLAIPTLSDTISVDTPYCREKL